MNWKTIPLSPSSDAKLKKKLQQSPVDFTARLTPIEKRWCIEIGQRAASLHKSEGAPKPGQTGSAASLAFVELNPVIAVMDIAVTHIHRDLDLIAFAQADNLTMIAEYAIIQRNINRPLTFFPKDVKLKFARR